MRKEHYYERAGLLDPGLVARYWRLVAPARRVLDVGCGQGCFGRLKPFPDCEVTGVDVDEAALESASRFETTRLVDLDGGAIPFADGTFDAAFVKDVIEHVQDPLRLLREVRRVTRPGGAVVVSTPMEFPWVVWGDYTHVRGFTREAVGGVVEDAGLGIVHLVPMGAVPLAGRLSLVDAIPTLLRFPGARRMFGRSWEVLARRPAESP